MANEPVNLGTLKQKLIQYHDTGAYDQDINSEINLATKYLQQRLASSKSNPHKLAIILDIDETSLSNYQNMLTENFGGRLEEIRDAEIKGLDPAIKPTLNFYRFAKAHHVAVFFISGRHEDERDITIKNLKTVGFEQWDGLILRDGEYLKTPAATYKSAMRKKLNEEGYDIVLNIGDQNSDLAGGYADKGIKLANPYYFIA